MNLRDETELWLFELTGDIEFAIFVLKYFSELELKAFYLATETDNDYLRYLMTEARNRHAEAKQKY